MNRTKTCLLKIWCLVVLLVFIPPTSASVQEETAGWSRSSPENQPSPIRVACVGDSITAGARVASGTESYPAQLQSILGDRYLVKNFGVGGATLLKSGRPTVWDQCPAIRAFQPDWIVVSLGTNDTVSSNRRNWEQIESFDSDYRELLEQWVALPSKPKVLVATPTDMVLDTPDLNPARLRNLTERRPRLLQLCQQIRDMVSQWNHPNVALLPLTPVLQGHPEWLTSGDGVHPNRQGYQQIAKSVAHGIREFRPPNIVLFLVDDMGWQDTSVPFHSRRTPLNRKYRTPNMETLASRGMTFTQAYACSVCSPTRVSLMTGWNAARHRVTNWTLHRDRSTDRAHPRLDFPSWNVNGIGPSPDIPRTVQSATLPALLGGLGYRTLHVGKAHFGAIGTPASDPREIGFDINIAGHAAGGPGSYLGTQNFSAAWRGGDRLWDVPDLEAYHGQDIFLTQALTIEANRLIDESVASDVPFFLYLAHYAVHMPLAADPRYFQSYLDLGLDQKEAMYAGLVQGMDESLGKIIAKLEQHEIDDNTIVLFLSDNGGLSAQGRGGTPHTHNLPLSSGKGSAHEGGIRVPMIVSWPGNTAPNSRCSQPVIVEDFFPTILEMAGFPDSHSVLDSQQGVSFVDLLSDPLQDRSQRPLFWHMPNHWGPSGPGIGPSSTIRKGDFKLIYYHDGPRMELFHLGDDIGEETNLVTQHPEQCQLLARQLSNYLRSVDAQMPTEKATGQVIPWPDQWLESREPNRVPE